MSHKLLINHRYHIYHNLQLHRSTFGLNYVRTMAKKRPSQKKSTDSHTAVNFSESDLIPYITQSSKGLLSINLKVTPNAKDNKLKIQGEELTVHITAKPVDNQANSQVVKLMAKVLTLKPYQLELVSGSKSRHKTVQIVDSGCFDSQLDLHKRILSQLSIDSEL